MKTTLSNPVEMLKQGAPRIIRSDRELVAYTDALFALTAKARPTQVEMDAIDLLSLLIQTYESQHRDIPSASPVDILKYLMQSHGMKQRDLTPYIGSESLVSLILAGKRSLTVDHMKALAARFHVPAGIFLGSAMEQAA